MNRRELIQKTLAGFGALSLPISLTACGDDADSNTQPNTQVQFLHGVASGDPLQTQVYHLDTCNTDRIAVRV